MSKLARGDEQDMCFSEAVKQKKMRPWTHKEDDRLIELLEGGMSRAAAGRAMERSLGSVDARLSVIRVTVGYRDGRTKSPSASERQVASEGRRNMDSVYGKPIVIWLAAMQRINKRAV